jgi:hypothetical protein
MHMKGKKSSGKRGKRGKRAVKKPLDLRTKAGRAWKAREVQKALRAKAIAREAGKAAAALAVSGSWVDLKAHAAKKVAEVQAAAAVCGLVDGVRLSGPLFAEARKSLALDRGEQQTISEVRHFHGDACVEQDMQSEHAMLVAAASVRPGFQPNRLLKPWGEESVRPAHEGIKSPSSVRGAYSRVMV